MKRALVIVFTSMVLSVSGQTFTSVPDSVDFTEYHEHISLFNGALTFGRTIRNLYFVGADASLEVSEGDTDVIEEPEKQRLGFEYVKEPTLLFTYGGKKYEVRVRLIQVDWPGNEINWRMIPRVYFTPVS